MGDTPSVPVRGTELAPYRAETPSSNRDQSPLARTAAAPTQENGIIPKFENSQLFVSSIKALQNSTSKTFLDNHNEHTTNANDSKLGEHLIKYEDTHQKIESNAMEELKVGSKIESDICQQLSTPSPQKLNRKTLKPSTPTIKGRKLQMEGKDDENSSVRPPLEILKDVFADKDLSENLTEDLQNILRAKAAHLKEVSPVCNCAALGLAVDDNGPFYTQLGYARTQVQLKQLFLDRLETTETALRMEKVRFTPKEGVTSEGCPIAKWVIRRTNDDEKYLVVVKERYGHQCEWTWIAMSLVQWDGVPPELADKAYDQITDKTANYGSETERKCGANSKKTCACQGSNGDYNGASYTFGCSWTMYTNCCKFCKSSEARKYRLKQGQEEGNLENICDLLTDSITPHFAKLAPDCYNNMCLFEEVAADCRIGTEEGRPFSGITTVLDYCAHSHKDNNNMIGGCTVVVSLIRPENRGGAEVEVEDEQYHVLPLYMPDGTEAELEEKMNAGGLDVLSSFPRTITIKSIAKKCCKRGRMTAEKKRMLDGYIPENFCSTSPTTVPKTPKKSPVKKILKPKEPKKKLLPMQNIQEEALEEGAVAVSSGFVSGMLSQFSQSQASLLQDDLLAPYSPSYQRRPIPSVSYSSPVRIERQTVTSASYSSPVRIERQTN